MKKSQQIVQGIKEGDEVFQGSQMFEKIKDHLNESIKGDLAPMRYIDKIHISFNDFQ